MYNCARESVKRFSQRERKSFKMYYNIQTKSKETRSWPLIARTSKRKRDRKRVHVSLLALFFPLLLFSFFSAEIVVVRVSSQKTASPFQKRNKRHFFYHKRERFKVDLNTRTKAQNTHTKHSSEQRERATKSTFWLFKESHAESAYIFFHE